MSVVIRDRVAATKSVLLTKAEVGCQKPTIYRLPTGDHLYGKSSPKRTDSISDSKPALLIVSLFSLPSFLRCWRAKQDPFFDGWVTAAQLRCTQQALDPLQASGLGVCFPQNSQCFRLTQGSQDDRKHRPAS